MHSTPTPLIARGEPQAPRLDWGFAYVIDGETGWLTILRFRLAAQRRG